MNILDRYVHTGDCAQRFHGASECTCHVAGEVARDPTNADRAARGAFLVNAYIDELGGDGQNALRDMLADLMHYASANGLDFEDEARIARGHFDAEVREEA
jgi:hypothetical protein